MVVKNFPSTSIHNAKYSHSPLSRRFLLNSILMCTALVLFSITFIKPVLAQDGEEPEVTVGATISWGVAQRIESQDPERSVMNSGDGNSDDGNLNYAKGDIISNTLKLTSDIQVENGNTGVFGRFTAFVDDENDGARKESRTQLSDDAKELVASDIRLLDLYLYHNFESEQVIGDVRVGNIVLNWGESTFIQNGINAINPVDVSRLRTPGSELREALVPVPMITASVSPNDRLTFEGFLQTEWKPTEIDPVGSYFSRSDYIGAGATQAELDLRSQVLDEARKKTESAPPDKKAEALTGARFLTRFITPDDQDNWLSVKRDRDVTPSDSGQYGVALRYLTEGGNETEIGAYYINYHSRRPLVSANTGNLKSLLRGLEGAGAIKLYKETLKNSLIRFIKGTQTPDAFNEELTTVLNRILPQMNPTIKEVSTEVKQTARQLTGLGVHLRQIGQPGRSPQAAISTLEDLEKSIFELIATQISIDRFAQTASYQVEYPEDIGLFGLSFNSLLGSTGWAIQGEASFRSDAPLQIDDELILRNALSYLKIARNSIDKPDEDANSICSGIMDTIEHSGCIVTVNLAKFGFGQNGTKVDGVVRRDVSQFQLTGTKLFGPISGIGAEGGVFISEIATTQIHSMPDPKILPLEGSGSSTGTADSWGYRLATRLDYPNAIGPVSLSPYLQYQHDVSGTTPAPISNFIKGRKTWTYGIGANYLDRWTGNFSVTQYKGAGLRNPHGDRDFMSLSVGYTF